MAAITAQAVAQLREQTGAGMMQCKAALTEANGDMEEAKVILRKKLGNKATERGATRTASQGLTFAYISDSKTVGALVELNCETDFVARNPEFQAIGRALAQKIASYPAGQVPANLDTLLAEPMEGASSVQGYLNDKGAPLGEKVALSRFERFGAPQGNVVGSYVHNPGGSGDAGGAIGVLVEVTGGDGAATIAREVALHVASANPQYLSEADVEQGILDKEREIARAQADADPKMQGKPEGAINAMVNGRVRKFLEETVLLNQAYVRDPAKTVGALVKETSGAGVVRFVRFRVGELQADQAPAAEAAENAGVRSTDASGATVPAGAGA